MSVGANRFLLAAAAAVALFLVAYGVLILTSGGQELENLALAGARQEVGELRESSLSDLSQITTLSFGVAVGLVMLIATLRRKLVLALTAALVMGTSVAIAEVAKLVLIRPELVDAPPRWLSNSFPSGHVTIAVAVGIGLVMVVPYALRPMMTILAALFALGIGQAVEVAGWHRLSGVIGATCLVLAVASLALFVLARSGRIRLFEKPRWLGVWLVTLLVGGFAALLGLGGVFFGLVRLLPVPESPSENDLDLAYTATLLVGTAVIALGFVTFLWLIRPYAIDERRGEVVGR